MLISESAGGTPTLSGEVGLVSLSLTAGSGAARANAVTVAVQQLRVYMSGSEINE